MVRPIAHGPLQLRPHPVKGHGFQALDFPAGLALEVGMGRVMLAGQFKVVHPALQGELAHHTPAVKILQDAVYRDLVHPAAGPDGCHDLLGPEGPGGLSQDFQYRQPHRGGPEALLDQPPGKITTVTHTEEILENQLSCKYIMEGTVRNPNLQSSGGPSVSPVLAPVTRRRLNLPRSTSVWLARGPATVPLYCRPELAPGRTFSGPALVLEDHATLLVLDGFRGEVLDRGHILLRW